MISVIIVQISVCITLLDLGYNLVSLETERVAPELKGVVNPTWG